MAKMGIAVYLDRHKLHSDLHGIRRRSQLCTHSQLSFWWTHFIHAKPLAACVCYTFYYYNPNDTLVYFIQEKDFLKNLKSVGKSDW
jgi:hypothetical protein